MSFSAILSASRTTADTPAGLRASLHFAGQTLIEYQARQAAYAGADRIMILVSVITPAVSQAVDRLSADGIAVALVRDMVSMVRDVPRDTDVLLIADGAIVAQAHVDALGATEGNTLLVADDTRASAPFERIDAGQRWAGVARITPALLFDTLDMIGDWDLSLTLVRAAVQKGARRITAPQDDLLEGRVAMVDSQQQADLVAQAVTAAGTSRTPTRGGIEHYVLAPLARMASAPLMRMQVPAFQVRITAIALGAPPAGVFAFATPVLALMGIVLAGRSPLAVDLALLLVIIVIADRQGRTGEARPWMIFTPGSALLLMVGTGLFGLLAQGLRVAMLLAIASVGAIILRRRT